MVDFGSLRSPLPASELANSMKRKIDYAYRQHLTQDKAWTKKEFLNCILCLRENLHQLEGVGKQTKVMIVKSLERVKEVKSTLKAYKRNLNKRLKETKKNAQLKQQINQEVEKIDYLLNRINEIKNKTKKETKKSIIEEQKVYRFANRI